MAPHSHLDQAQRFPELHRSSKRAERHMGAVHTVGFLPEICSCWSCAGSQSSVEYTGHLHTSYWWFNLLLSSYGIWRHCMRSHVHHSRGCDQPKRKADLAYCSWSRRRPQKVDKRMVLEHTHGLLITWTEFRLSTTFIPIIIIIYT